MMKFAAFVVLLLTLFSLNLVIPFELAYFTGRDEFTWQFNWYGEKHIEAVLFPVIVILGIVVFVKLWRWQGKK